VRGWLLDTNVVSELARPRPSPQVRAFLAALEGVAHLSVVTLHELDFGIVRHPDRRRRERLSTWLRDLEMELVDFILPVDRGVARSAARLRHVAERAGRRLHLADALIAATAAERGLCLVTRNLRDFDVTGVPLLDPFAERDH
jgi:predicted nucleic acid-binding protein